MKSKLKEITDLTVSELLSNEIILPSNYFQCFDKHAKTIDIDINTNSETFEKELNSIIVNDFIKIEEYINTAIKTVDNAASLTLDAQKAIKEKNTSSLKDLYSQIKKLQKELQNMTSSMYQDSLTKVNNKKWLYHKYLNDEANYKNDAVVVLIDVYDYDYIAKNYNKLISDNLLIYVAKYFQNKLKEESLNFEVTRFLDNKFVITLDENNLAEVENFIHTSSDILYNTTLKSNSGIIIKPRFKYSIKKVSNNESFHESINILLENMNKSN